MTIALLLHRVSSFQVATATATATASRTRPLSFLVLGGRHRRHSFSSLAAASAANPNERHFQVTAPYEPTGDQPLAIQQLVNQLEQGDKYSILRGITGTGKTFVMSHVISHLNKPTLVLCHNKTLAAQLARELRSFFPDNAVELFVSYYNSYIPESFVETTGTYTAKKCSVNDEIDALRHRATRALLERRDVVVVASVSCIYGLGLPTEYLDASTAIHVNDEVVLFEFVQQLEGMLYTRPENADDMLRGNYQLSAANLFGTGATQTLILSLWPPHEKFPMRIELETVGDVTNIKSILSTNASGGLASLDSLHIFPARHHVASEERVEAACLLIEQEMKERVAELTTMGKLVESSRLQQRVLNDVLLLRETGFCPGGENYSRHFAGRNEGEPPDTLIDYLKVSGGGDWLLVVDESHVTLPQLKAMYAGDRSRKERLVKHGYRLPSALDNRPLKNEEFWEQIRKCVFVSATPSKQELALTERPPVEMMIRPTFVCDPIIELRPPEGQLDDLLEEIKIRAQRQERTLALALTKRDAEDLSSYILEHDINATYIHSGLTTQERSDALKALQSGDIDCLVGVNLLREGLDLPQVSLVAILNADSEGFLRSETALLQTVGRAARNTNGKAIFYAARVTDSMQRCMDDTSRRRERQLAYNEEFNCTSISTKGSSMMSIFDLLKEEIESEQPLEIVRPGSKNPAEGVPRELQLVELPTGSLSMNSTSDVITEHLPSKPGVYFWKDAFGKILYIGKAKKLRSRVKSYLSRSAKHSPRIKIMLAKATTVEFVLTPSERDALVLESNLIKHHQPAYNVLLKDDAAYPYICASVGDAYPRFSAVPRRQAGEKASKYRYFGPYPQFKEINSILAEIEERYDLRAKSFGARHGSGTKQEYKELFDHVMDEVFEGNAEGQAMVTLREEYEEASLLFGSPYNKCRDVVAIGQSTEGAKEAIVLVVQLRNGLVAGRFSYACMLPEDCQGTQDLGSVIETVLARQHYPSGSESAFGGFSFFPDEVLLQYPIESVSELKRAIKTARTEAEPDRSTVISVRHATSRGPRRQTDERAVEFAADNAKQVAIDGVLESDRQATKTSLDGTANKELASMLSLEKAPSRIECYDISHTQGEVPVGSRVVFINGKPAPELYRKFNIKTVEGIDDYASLEEVLQRRFSRVWVNGTGGLVGQEDPWSMPDLVVIDGGIGQLGAAIKGMAKSSIFPHEADVLNDRSELIVEEQVLDDGFLFPSDLALLSSRKTFVPICALAKNKEEVFVFGRKGPVNDTPDSAALLLLRSLRDESHRFALSSHRKRRSVAMKK